MSVRRARRTARLRKRGVNGHVLPLLLFLADGWGWKEILPDLQKAADKGWSLDQSYLNKPNRVRTPEDLLDNAQDADEWIDHPDHRAIVDLRSWLYSQIWFGESQGDASPVPFLTSTLPHLLGVATTIEQQAQPHAARREALRLPGSGLGQWLANLNPEVVERGRTIFWVLVRCVRLLSREAGLPGSNPLTLGGKTTSEIATDFRASPGRITPAQVLGACIVQAMVISEIAPELAELARRE